jgi:hypothetical protein
MIFGFSNDFWNYCGFFGFFGFLWIFRIFWSKLLTFGERDATRNSARVTAPFTSTSLCRLLQTALFQKTDTCSIAVK